MVALIVAFEFQMAYCRFAMDGISPVMLSLSTILDVQATANEQYTVYLSIRLTATYMPR